MTDEPDPPLRLEWTAHPRLEGWVVAQAGVFICTVGYRVKQPQWFMEIVVRIVDAECEIGHLWPNRFSTQRGAQLWCERGLLCLGQDIVAAFGKAGE